MKARMLHDSKVFINQVKVTKLKNRIEKIINPGKATMYRSWKGLFFMIEVYIKMYSHQ